MKKILLLEQDEELKELFANWLKQQGYEVKSTDNPAGVSTFLSEEKYDVLFMDIDHPLISKGSPEITKDLLVLCQTLKQDHRTSELPIAVLSYGKDIKKIAGAIEAGADSFVLKPFETDYLSKRLKTMFRDIELKKQGRKVLDLNYINFLIDLTGESKREDFFVLAPVIFNKLIMDNVNPILGDPIIMVMAKRLKELIGGDYEFMKAVKYSDGRVLMDDVDKVSKAVPVEKLTTAFRDYIYGFLHLVQTLTSDVLMERRA